MAKKLRKFNAQTIVTIHGSIRPLTLAKPMEILEDLTDEEYAELIKADVHNNWEHNVKNLPGEWDKETGKQISKRKK